MGLRLQVGVKVWDRPDHGQVPVGVGGGDPVGVRLFKDGMGVHEGDRVRVGVPLLETDSRLVTDSVRPMLWVWVPDSGLEV